MTDTNAAPAPIVAPVSPRAPISLNGLCLAGVVALSIADIAALAAGVSVGAVSLVSGPVMTGLFAVINRGAAA
jgi:hypothetical protein